MKLSPNDGALIGDIQFPRTEYLPVQSPLYWVGQKDRYLRQLLIRDIEKLTSRRLIVYFANRELAGSGIDHRDPNYLVELLSDVGPDEACDILIETTGGYTDATEAVISLIRCRLKNFRVVIANNAKSNGTLICLSAESIVMGAPSELGPIDPQLNDLPCTVLAKPEVAVSNYPLQQLAELALKQTRKLAKVLLTEGMLQGKAETEIDSVVRALSSSDVYYSHGSTIDQSEAKRLGLNVEYLPPEDEIWQRIWLLYTMYDFDIRRSNLLKIFEGRGRSTSVAPAL
jgi:hypothetical protein